MGRHRWKHRDLPPGVYASEKNGKRYFYFGRQCIGLGTDFGQMLTRYAALVGQSERKAPTFADAAARYLVSEEFREKAPKTQREYRRQAVVLTRVFGQMPLDDITPKNVRDYLKARAEAKIAATREKALLSLIFTFAREEGLTNSPNPVAGIRGKKSIRALYVTHDQLQPVIKAAEDLGDAMLADFLRVAYYTGQDVGRIVGWTARDLREGELWNTRDKTGEKVRIAAVGPLGEVLERLVAGKVGAARLFQNQDGSRVSLQVMRRRFWEARSKAGQTWQLRDLRAKAASDVDSTESAQALLAHADITTTGIYRRRVAGTRAKPVMQKI